MSEMLVPLSRLALARGRRGGSRIVVPLPVVVPLAFVTPSARSRSRTTRRSARRRCGPVIVIVLPAGWRGGSTAPSATVTVVVVAATVVDTESGGLRTVRPPESAIIGGSVVPSRSIVEVRVVVRPVQRLSSTGDSTSLWSSRRRERDSRAVFNFASESNHVHLIR